jgi:hypothetical protein
MDVALPPHGSQRSLNDLVAPADTLKVFVGGNNVMPEGALAETNDADPIWRSGPPDWKDTINFRGQVGASQSPATDYGPWGAVIMFNARPSDIAWHFGRTTDGLDREKFDFLTVAMHELMHVLGFGLAESFQTLTDSTSDQLQFAGSQTLALGGSSTNNADLQLHDGGHWAVNTLGVTGEGRVRALMGPMINPGKRLYPTTLDRAALRDLGWQEGLAGDANLDGTFDNFDLILVLQAAKYQTGEIAGWSEGNWNDDFVFDQNDIVAALTSGVFLTGPYQAISTVPFVASDRTSTVWETNLSEMDAVRGVERTSTRMDSGAFFLLAGGPLGGQEPTNVPEPSSILLLCLGAWVALKRRMARNRV